MPPINKGSSSSSNDMNGGDSSAHGGMSRSNSSRPLSPFSPCFEKRSNSISKSRHHHQQQRTIDIQEENRTLFRTTYVRQRVEDFVGDRSTQQFWVDTVRKDIEQCLVEYQSTTIPGLIGHETRQSRSSSAEKQEDFQRKQERVIQQQQSANLRMGLQKHRQRITAQENEKFLEDFRRRKRQQQQKQKKQRHQRSSSSSRHRIIPGFPPLSPVIEQPSRHDHGHGQTIIKTVSRSASAPKKTNVTHSPTSVVEIEWESSEDEGEEDQDITIQSPVHALHDALGDAETVVASGNSEKQARVGVPSWR